MSVLFFLNFFELQRFNYLEKMEELNCNSMVCDVFSAHEHDKSVFI
jgi:hypothetical protein